MINDLGTIIAGLMREAAAGSIARKITTHAITFTAAKDQAGANSGMEDINSPNIYQ